MSFALNYSFVINVQIFITRRSLNLNHALPSPLKFDILTVKTAVEMVSGLAGGDLALSPLLQSSSPFLVRQHIVTSAF